jgi:hypothetical protein
MNRNKCLTQDTKKAALSYPSCSTDADKKPEKTPFCGPHGADGSDRPGEVDAGGVADPGADLFGARLDQQASQPRGPGRPLGVQNKHTDALVKLIAAKHGITPAELKAATVMHGLREHLAAGLAPGEFMASRAKALAKDVSRKV